MKKYMLLFLSVVLIIALTGCTAANVETVPPSTAPQFDYARYGTTREEVQTQLAQYGKGSHGSYENADFRTGVVIIGVYPFALDYAYTAGDFSEVGCTEVRQLGYYPDDKDMPTKLLVLTISDQTKQGVIDAINVLILRDDVYSAQPDIILSIN